MESRQREMCRDFNQKLTTRLVRDNRVIVLEGLNVSGMLKNRRLARVISQAGWRQIRTLCEVKSKMITEREVRTVDQYFSLLRSVRAVAIGGAS